MIRVVTDSSCDVPPQAKVALDWSEGLGYNDCVGQIVCGHTLLFQVWWRNRRASVYNQSKN
jgi:hypothetical protein